MVGFDLLDLLSLIVAQWAIIFIINLVPALMPPTWAVLSFFYITNPQNIFLLIFIGVTASTCGRFALAKISGYVTNKFASQEKKDEFEAIQSKLQGKPWQKFIFTLIYALSPLPSNALFIAFGATGTKLREVLAGFFVGRTISYLFLVFTTQKVFSSLESTMQGNASLWTLMIEVIGVIAVIAFFVVDWNKIIVFATGENTKQTNKKSKKKKSRK
jgi:membrane protein YqaA with SNARE-associated domain